MSLLCTIIPMFGMQDPSQTLLQIERYIAEGRLEISEVMATQFCELMLATKKREPQQRIFLLKGLRLLCDVYLLRGKSAQSMKSISRMHAERKLLTKVLQRHAPEMLASMRPEHEDHLRAGKLYAAAGKKKAAVKSFSRCEKLSPGHLAAALSAVEAMPTATHVQRLLTAIELAGDVILSNGQFQLQPHTSQVVSLDEVLQSLMKCCDTVPAQATACRAAHSQLIEQQSAIRAGEQAANARLQSALDSLQPKHDYYQYG